MSCSGPAGSSGTTILSEAWYTPNQLVILAPGAFIGLGFLIAIYNAIQRANKEEGGTP